MTESCAWPPARRKANLAMMDRICDKHDKRIPLTKFEKAVLDRQLRYITVISPKLS